jgi:hypothetical protein
LTGISVRVGNFSVAPIGVVRRLIRMPELWNHYAGAIYKSKVPFKCIPLDRGRRLRGRSHMNLPALVAHGIAGIATFQEAVATRILLSTVIGLGILVAAFLLVAGIRMGTNAAIPGWATTAKGFVLILGIQLVAIAFNLVFTLISNRTSTAFVPARDYALFVDRIETLAVRE